MPTVEKILVVVVYVVSLVINGLAASGVLSGLPIGEVSAQYPTYVTPDNLTFLVWSVIYTLESLECVRNIIWLAMRFFQKRWVE